MFSIEKVGQAGVVKGFRVFDIYVKHGVPNVAIIPPEKLSETRKPFTFDGKSTIPGCRQLTPKIVINRDVEKHTVLLQEGTMFFRPINEMLG